MRMIAICIAYLLAVGQQGCATTDTNREYPSPLIVREQVRSYTLLLRAAYRYAPTLLRVSEDGFRYPIACSWSRPVSGVWACRATLPADGFAFIVRSPEPTPFPVDVTEAWEMPYSRTRNHIVSERNGVRLIEVHEETVYGRERNVSAARDGVWRVQ